MTGRQGSNAAPSLDVVRVAFAVNVEPFRQAFRDFADAVTSIGSAVVEALVDESGLDAWTRSPERAALRELLADSDEVMEELRAQEPPEGMGWLWGIRAK